ncbi:MAG: hypothetical protein IJS05_02455 [Paludibacteraceae bacterium]|nr:hypothetical protein [Paludibacteraceae bacterium]
MESQLIQTKDNSKKTLDSEEVHILNKLREIAGVSINNIKLENNPNLLVFPQCLNECKDNIQDKPIFSLEGSNCIKTGNIMGFVGYNGTHLRIYSRFAQEDSQDYFMHYMLQRVFAINLFNLKYTTDTDSIFNFLIYLFPAFLKRATSQGLYREYQTKHYNDSNIRGRIDISRHIKQNIPFTGKIAYSSREYTADNAVTQLIRHTIDYISHHPYCGNILQNDEETKRCVSQIQAVTNSTYNSRDRQRVINQNLRAIRHPYFSEYRNLQKLCLQILRHEELKYGTNNDEIYGILFDGAWLWEEYLAIVLKGVMIHYTKQGPEPLYLFKGKHQRIIPDFLNKSTQIVADAKYIPLDKKHISEGSESEIDIYYKTLVYMYRFNCHVGFLLYPDSKSQQEELCIEGKTNEILYKIGMEIPQKVNNWNDFIEVMGNSEEEFLSEINSHIQ